MDRAYARHAGGLDNAYSALDHARIEVEAVISTYVGLSTSMGGVDPDDIEALRDVVAELAAMRDRVAGLRSTNAR